MVPGAFTEIYHFSQQSDWSNGKSSKKYVCELNTIGDEFAKSPLLADYFKELDYTDKLFYEVWKGAIKEAEEKRMNAPKAESNEQPSTSPNPFATNVPKWKT
jgi:hypothetical protein